MLKKSLLGLIRKIIFKNFLTIKKKDENYFFIEIEKQLVQTQFKFKRNFLNSFLDLKNLDINILIKQILVEKFLPYIRYTKVFFLKSEYFFFPLPFEISKNLLKNINKFNIFINYFLFLILNFYFLFKSIVTLLRIILANNRVKTNDNENSIFINLGNFNQYNLGKDVNLVNWYRKHFMNQNNELHNYLITKNKRKFLKNKNLYKSSISKINLIKFFIFSIFYIFLSFFNLILLRWQYSFIATQVIEALFFKFIDNTSLYKEYLFINKTFIYRPIWTYVVENKKSKITFIFYSCSLLTNYYMKNINNSLWKLATWPQYYFWDDEQYKFIKNNNRIPFVYKKYGFIPYVDNGNIKLKKADICIFDEPPLKLTDMIMAGLNDNIWTIKNSIKFLEDILEISKKKNLVVCLKIKKKNSKLVKSYFRRIDQLSNKYSNLRILDYDIAPSRLIKLSKISISFPFSSTAVIAKFLKKKIIYYFPYNFPKFTKKTLITRNIPLIINKTNLEKFIDKTFNE